MLLLVRTVAHAVEMVLLHWLVPYFLSSAMMSFSPAFGFEHISGSFDRHKHYCFRSFPTSSIEVNPWLEASIPFASNAASDCLAGERVSKSS